MKNLFVIISLIILSSCATTDQLYPEDELFITRKYAGNFVSANIIPKQRITDVQVIEIFTTMSDYDTIRIYAKKLMIRPGERLYLRRTSGYSSQWKTEYYNLETDTQQFRICEFAVGNKLLTQSWY